MLLLQTAIIQEITYLKMPDFTHLHVHTQFSILDGAAKIPDLLDTAVSLGMDSLAITDHGNLYGVLNFFQEARARGVKPVIGCEVYVSARTRHDKFDKVDRDSFHLILLAKDLEGYRNLSRLSSLGYTEGFYYHPRVDKELLRKYRHGLIASSACLGGEIPRAIMNRGEDQAALVLEEYLDIFGEDFYLELMNHGLPEQMAVNKVLKDFSARYGVKLIATNDVHFIRKEDFEAHHILICLNTGKDIDAESSLSYTGQEYLKSKEEVAALFPDIPEALANTQEIVAKVENYDITSKTIILPHFPLPGTFNSEDDYLRHLTYEGAAKLYPELTDEIRERLDFELSVIKQMGFPGYFLIVQDFIRAARQMGVIVGPGRGSAAGSAVAYCTGITNIDPIRYNLLFERFLNPERVTMPDIDIDFDDEGREKVLKYVVEKYGREKVAQIVTFGTMAAKLAIRDVARVLKLPLPDADRLAKLVPEKPGISLSQAYNEVKELSDIKKDGEELQKKTLLFAETLEGSARHTGTHACGVIIGPDDLMDHIPLSTAKDSDLPVTQYDGKLVESVGMLKMDFLGLKTLSIIKDAIDNIRRRHNFEIDVDNIPLDDKKTFELYQRGDTIGTFQFESDGMRNYLKELKPNNIEDLIAMNALYRPGPMNFIPIYINRKHGREKVEYPHPLLEEILKPTYGIMVYQEQIMQTAQLMAGFSLGKADLLRRAMGKKKMDAMVEQRAEFVKGAGSKGIPGDIADEVFSIMERFAEYGFNRSHSAAYSVIAYHTAYLKANYTAEYMAAVLTHNLSDIKKIKFFIDECKRQNIDVLGPDINESSLHFTVNEEGQIRFGLGAVKGVGEGAVKSILEEKEQNGPFKSIFDFAKRVNLRNVNRRCIEALVMAGSFDSFEGTHRAQYFYRSDTEDSIFLDKIIRFASGYQERINSAQQSLFGDEVEVEIEDPALPDCKPWSKLQQLKNEKDVTGFYMSGHPLDNYRIEIDNFCNCTLADLNQNLRHYENKQISFAGMIISSQNKITKNGKPFGSFVMEDYTDTRSFMMFSEEYLKMKHFLDDGAHVLARARVEKRFNSDDQLEVKISSMILLPDVLEKFTKSIRLSVNVSDLSSELVQTIQQLIKAYPGNCPVRIKVRDPLEKIGVELKTKNNRVNPAAFTRDVQKVKEIECKLF